MSAERLVKRLPVPWRGLPIGGALALALCGAPAFAANSFSTDWALASKSQARLIAGGGDLAGFEIALAPGAITYWRDPGDAGLPPTLDFSASDNVASVEPEFPAPKRIMEADGRRGIRLRRRCRLSLASQAARPGEARDTQAQRRFRRVRESLPAGQKRISSSSLRRLRARLVRGRSRPP